MNVARVARSGGGWEEEEEAEEAEEGLFNAKAVESWTEAEAL